MMRIFLILALALIGAGNTAAADIEANDIIRSLAPITYLPEHGGKPRRAIDLEVRFESGSARLTPDAQRLLDTLATALQDGRLASSRFEVAGHTDASGSRAYNQSLSEKRAGAVVTYLTSRHGVDRKRLSPVGKGEDALKDPLNPTGRANRRVEIVNLTPVQPAAQLPTSQPAKKANDILMGR